MTKRLRLGFIPLVDAAALIVAVDKGFSAAEGLDVELVREVSWSNVRDKLNIGLFDAAHLLAPVAVASSLSLVHVSGPIGARLSVAEERIWPADLVGHLNLIHPTRLQVLGAAELAWAQRQANEKVAHHLNEILSAHPPAIIVADGCEIPNILHGICEAHDVALFTARHPSASVSPRNTAIFDALSEAMRSSWSPITGLPNRSSTESR